MGFRFRKSIKLGKGVKLNVGKKSVGISAGGKRGGISINSRTGARARVSAPGTGISYTTKLSGGKNTSKSAGVNHSAASRSTKKVSTTKAGQSNAQTSKRPKNPPKPPKSPKLYLQCGIILALLGILMFFLFWPFGLLSLGIGAYYIACGPKIYTKLAEDYKAVHPEFEEFTIK